MSARQGRVEGYGPMQEGETGSATGERVKDDMAANRAESGRISVGVVGSGGMGCMHAENLRWKVPGARLAAVADPDTTRAEELAERCGPATVFEDPVDLIRDRGIEAVVVASPDPTHAPLVLECLRNEKPVLCEKPLADSSGAALQIVEAEVGLGKRLVQVGFMRRYDPQHVAVKEAVASGAVGAPVLFKGWHRNVGFGQGRGSESVVVGATIHDLDSTRWFLGQEIAEVYARGVNTEPELGEDVWDLQLIHLLTTGGRMGTIETYVSSRYGYEVGVEIVGERGTVQTSPPTGAVVRREGMSSQRIEQDWLDRFRAAYEVEARLWIESLLNGTPGGPDAWDGYASLVAADACVASLRSGSPERVARLDRPALYGGREPGAGR